MDKYIFEWDRESNTQRINVINIQTSTLEAQYRLDEDRRIEDIKLYYEDCFYILIDTGAIYLGQIGVSGLENLVLRQGSYSPGHYLDKELKELWIACKKEKERKYVLQCWHLLDKKCIQEIELPDYTDLETLTRRSDGCFLFYKSTEREANGFYCVDTFKEEVIFHELPSKAVSNQFDRTKNFLFVHNRDIAVLPACDEFISSENENKNIQYHYQIQVINLNDFSVISRNTIRKFTIDEICSYYDDKEELEENVKDLVQNNHKYRYHKGTEKWLGFLDSINICNDEDAFWLRWDDFSIIKVDFEGNIKTPLYHLNYERGSFVRSFNKKLRANKDELIIIDNTLINAEPYYQIDLTQETKQKDGKTILEAKEISAKEVSISDTYRTMIKEFGVNLIEAQKLYMQEKNEALSILIQKMKDDMDSLVFENRLVFEFIDKYGQIENEGDFIGHCIFNENNQMLFRELMQTFNKYEKAKNLKDEKNRPAFSETALYLLDESHFDLLKIYFNTIDPNNAEFFIEEVLPQVGEHFEEDKKYEDFINSIPKEFFSNKKETLNWF